MQHGIREFRPRQPLDRQLSSDTLNRILRELESLRITRVVNGTFKKLPGGTEIVVAPQRGGSSSPLEAHPFQITSRQHPENENQYIVTVRPGTLNNVLASNWNAELTVPAASLRYIVLSASANNSAIVSTSMSADSSPPSGEQSPQKWALPTSFKVILGLVLGPQVWQVVYDNLSYASAKRITTDRANPAIGQLPYDNWYIWQLQP